MAYTKRTKKVIEEANKKLYDLLIKIGLPKEQTEEAAKIQKEMLELERENDLQYKLNKRGERK